MIHLSNARRYYLYRPACDMRKGFSGLCGLVLSHFSLHPDEGSVFIFLNRRRNRLKLLCWEGDGFGLYYKVLRSGTFSIPSGMSHQMSSCEVQLLLSGVELSSVKYRQWYKPES